jgi:hypothetical protein
LILDSCPVDVKPLSWVVYRVQWIISGQLVYPCFESAPPRSLSHSSQLWLIVGACPVDVTLSRSSQLTDGYALPQILQLLLLVVTEQVLLFGRYTGLGICYSNRIWYIAHVLSVSDALHMMWQVCAGAAQPHPTHF